jgi:hypothetical protein
VTLWLAIAAASKGWWYSFEAGHTKGTAVAAALTRPLSQGFSELLKAACCSCPGWWRAVAATCILSHPKQGCVKLLLLLSLQEGTHQQGDIQNDSMSSQMHCVQLAHRGSAMQTRTQHLRELKQRCKIGYELIHTGDCFPALCTHLVPQELPHPLSVLLVPPPLCI